MVSATLATKLGGLPRIMNLETVLKSEEGSIISIWQRPVLRIIPEKTKLF